MSANPLSDVDSWLYHLWDVSADTITGIAASDYDLVVIEYASYADAERPYTASELDAMRGDDDGRLIVSYLSIGEAESYRFYWDTDAFQSIRAEIAGAENPEWAENFKVRYWHEGWQQIIFDYVDRIIDAGFNGVYLDIIDGFYHWEETEPNSGVDYRQEMADFVAAIRTHALARIEAVDPGRPFVIIGQNGEELLENSTYLNAIDGVGSEDVQFYYSYPDDDDFTVQAAGDVDYRFGLLETAEAAGKQVFVIEYLSQGRQVEHAASLAAFAERLDDAGIALYVAENRDFDAIFDQPATTRIIDRTDGTAADDTLRGDFGRDVLAAATGNDQIWAGADDAGDDIVAGGAGNDTLAGGAGHDLIAGDEMHDGPVAHDLARSGDMAASGRDILYGGRGDDTLLGGGWHDGLVVDNGSYDVGEAVTDETAANTLWSGAGRDIAVGAAGADLIGGGAGNDDLSGMAGHDRLYGGAGAGADTLSGGGGNDSLYGGDGPDSLDGGDGNDVIFNGAGNDLVDGGQGTDTVWGGPGDDTLTGGAGADRFFFGPASGADHVSDFSVEEDILNLAATGFITRADMVAAATVAVIDSTSGVLIELGGGSRLFLAGLELSDLENLNLVL